MNLFTYSHTNNMTIFKFVNFLSLFYLFTFYLTLLYFLLLILKFGFRVLLKGNISFVVDYPTILQFPTGHMPPQLKVEFNHCNCTPLPFFLKTISNNIDYCHLHPNIVSY